MKILILALFVCACAVCACAVRICQVLSTQILRPVAVRLPLPPPPQFTLNEIIRAASSKHQVKPAFVKSIIAAESAFSYNALSPKGAIGLMQLMPETAREFGGDPKIPEQNVDAGTHYLSWLLQRYSNRRDQLRRTIAAYNAGPGAVERYHGVPPYRETRAYVSRVLKYFKKYQDQMGG